MLESIEDLNEQLEKPIILGRNSISIRDDSALRNRGALPFSQAESLRKKGDIESYRRIMAITNKFEKFTKYNKKYSKRYASPQGFSPIVPLAIIGQPNNMFVTIL